MGKKFKYLVLTGIKKKLKSKAFIITNIVIFILTVLLSNINHVIAFFGGDFDTNVIKLHIIDNTNKYGDTLIKYIDNLNESVKNFEMYQQIEPTLSNKKFDELKTEIKEKKDIILVIKEDDSLSFNLIAEDSISDLNYQQLTSAINMAKYEVVARDSNISNDVLNKLNSPANIEKTIINKDINDKSEENKKIVEVLFTIFILPFYILVILLINNIGAEINEEKSSKSMEVIISSISPKTHFFSKIVSNNLFVIGQMLLFIFYGLIGILVNNLLSDKFILSFQILDMFSKLEFSSNILFFLPLLLVMVISTFITYSLLTGILVSMTVNNEDLQHVSGPLIFISVIGYYLAILAGQLDGSMFIKVLGFIPLISCFLAPGLFITGQITLIGFLISILIVFIFNYFVAKYGVKIYKIGILNYSTDKMWVKIFKAVKE